MKLMTSLKPEKQWVSGRTGIRMSRLLWVMVFSRQFLVDEMIRRIFGVCVCTLKC